MNWLIIAFLAPLFWAISNFIDKLLISKYFKGGIGTLIIYSCLMGLPVAILIFLFKPEVLQVSFALALFMLLNGGLYSIYLFPYLKALHKADASTVIPVFQIIPVLSYLLAFLILGETLSKKQVIASLLIITGAIGISLKWEGRRTRLRKEVVLLILLASLIISITTVLFKFFAIDLNFWTVSFWYFLGSLILGILLLIFSKKYQKEFINSLKLNGKKIIGLNAINETVNTVAEMIFGYATLLAPLALVSVINGFQPLFVFLLGILLTFFAPHLIKEDISKRIILQKSVFIAVMIIGAYLLGT